MCLNSVLSDTSSYRFSQMDCYKEALTVLNRIPMGSQRANMDSYMEMISASFRANAGDEAMRLVKEYLTITSAKHRPLHFFHFVLRGFRYLKDSASAGVIYDLILQEEGIEPDYDTYREYISCLLEGRRFKLAIEVYETMVQHGFEIQLDLVNVYVTCFSASVNGDYHDRAWDMYIKGVLNHPTLRISASCCADFVLCLHRNWAWTYTGSCRTPRNV